MKQFVSWILGLPAAILLIAFALANRAPVTVSFDPLSSQTPWFALSLPVWVLLFAGIFLGLIIGWVGSWINQGKWRKAAREARSNLDIELEKKKALEKRLNKSELVPARSGDGL
ncbi:MAG TPA: LapA family protein [Rhizobiales bacterium]|nr:LapA family protein [Hyphomicrobiales bacterium]